MDDFGMPWGCLGLIWNLPEKTRSRATNASSPWLDSLFAAVRVTSTTLPS